MGHIRLGRLPRTRSWQRVLTALADPSTDVAQIAGTTIAAAKRGLETAASEAGLSYSFWLLAQITQAARSDDFPAALARLGLSIEPSATAFELLGSVAGLAERRLQADGPATPFGQFGQQAMREVLTELVGSQSETLFGADLENARIALRRYSTRAQFGALSRLFFAKFLSRSLKYFLDKESSNAVRPDGRFTDGEAVAEFQSALDGYTFQSARIVEEFAGGWYSKRTWQGGISEEDARGFVGYALAKLRSELEVSKVSR